MMRNIKLFSHTDLDGIGCNILIRSLYADSCMGIYDIENLNYDKINIRVKEFIINKEYIGFDTIFITDISVDEEVAVLLDNLHKDKTIDVKIILLDHHKTALWLNKYEWATVIETIELGNGEFEKTSGTEILYNYLGDYYSNSEDIWGYEFYLKDLVTQVKRYDTWLWKDKYNDIIPKQLNNLFYILGKDRFINLLSDNFNVDDFINSNKLLLELEQEKIDKYINEKIREVVIRKVNGYNIGIVFADRNQSELGNRLSEINSSLDLIAMIGANSISYRTARENIDCSEFAKLYNGGGHPKASGSGISIELQNKIIDLLFN